MNLRASFSILAAVVGCSRPNPSTSPEASTPKVDETPSEVRAWFVLSEVMCTGDDVGGTCYQATLVLRGRRNEDRVLAKAELPRPRFVGAPGTGRQLGCEAGPAVSCIDAAGTSQLSLRCAAAGKCLVEETGTAFEGGAKPIDEFTVPPPVKLSFSKPPT